MDNIIKKEYYRTFLGAKNLYNNLKEDHPSITLKQVTEIIKAQAVSQIHGRVKIPIKEFNQIRAPGRGEFQIDLAQMTNTKVKTRDTHSYSSLLIYIHDIHSLNP